MPRVYLDHNATTHLRPEARAALLETLDARLGNPSSAHASGRAARARVDEARERVAAALNVGEDEVLFTSGATEANNLALRGVMASLGNDAALVTTRIEHPSILEPAGTLEAHGSEVRLVGVDERGGLDAAEFVRVCAGVPGPVLASVSLANGEVGSLAPMEALAALGLGERTILHVDGVQALGRLPLALRDWGVSLASFSAHKVGGPAGVGVLVRRSGVPLVPCTSGGGQEFELRAGTENVAGIVAGACAIELAVREREAYAAHTSALVRLMCEELRRALPEVRRVGPTLDEARLPNTVNVLLPGLDGRVLVARLDLEGLEVSAGSACASGSLEPSSVLLALGLDRERARSGVRLSVGRTTTREDIHIAVEIMRRTVAGARRD